MAWQVSSLALSMACIRCASGRSVRIEISGREDAAERCREEPSISVAERRTARRWPSGRRRTR
jgi:hypothetical protein